MRAALSLLVLALLASCERATPSPSLEGPAATRHAPASAHAHDADALDGRRPLPLLPTMAHHQKESMRDHLVAVRDVVAALARDDLATVGRSASRMASSERMGQMCTHLGAAAPGFSEQALAFHRAADGVVEAAASNDPARVLAALDTTLQHCTACHAAWKQQVVDEATWDRLTAAAAGSVY